jgi:hypothetical protein
MNDTGSTAPENQPEVKQTTFAVFVLFVGIAPMMFSAYTDILGLPLGYPIEGIIMITIYLFGSVFSWWQWRRLRASIGWLLFALAIGILTFVGVKHNPVAMIAFFGGILSGGGLIIADGFVEATPSSAT